MAVLRQTVNAGWWNIWTVVWHVTYSAWPQPLYCYWDCGHM